MPASENGKIILIGASTGGVDALIDVLSHFPASCPPTVIVQHTGQGFGPSLVRLLQQKCRATVTLAEGRVRIRQGMVLVGAGIVGHVQLENPNDALVGVFDGPPVCGHVPSIDAMFHSFAPLAPSVCAALLTGMGKDGASGLKCLRDNGAKTIAQDERSSVVYGMPRVAKDMGAACWVLPLGQIGPALLDPASLNTSRVGLP